MCLVGKTARADGCTTHGEVYGWTRAGLTLCFPVYYYVIRAWVRNVGKDEQRGVPQFLFPLETVPTMC